MELRKPLIYFHGVVSGRYLPIWPVYVVNDDKEALTFTISVDEALIPELLVDSRGEEQVQRSYAIRLTRQRLHQVAFRERVLRAYRNTCAMCRLRHGALLDAAHILPDGHPRGEPTVPNGLSLCKLHHSAFDQHILGVKPDLRIVVRSDILEEVDGPMLVHGLQGFQDQKLHVPSSPRLRPNEDFLPERFELFLSAG
jgi:putative restriction endonuclease